eukprot:TRINITY_DN2739_c1_g1_i1.p1 TRINITY_DN2739_c1_g1~~TRINITY_DN2739_c1_g1_i1.p1  ORF type:complete len:431 (+),score=63.37 TRINITY_DN2739_c1_g1_i1:25-1293(+)
MKHRELATNFLHKIREREREVLRPNGKVKTSYFTPSLVEICARTIAADFANQPSIDHIDESLQRLVTTFLSPTLPVYVTVPRIQAEDYWKTCAEARWTKGQLGSDVKERARHDGWKRVYLEGVLEEFLTGLADEYPISAESTVELPRLCKLVAPWIQKLNVHRMKCHVDITQLFSWLPHLRDLQVTYGVLTSGMNFEMKMFGMRQQDCLYFAEVLRAGCTLASLRLPENQIDSDKLKALITGLVRNDSVTVLDLAHNAIEDAGVRALATLLTRKKEILKELNLCDNNIRTDGAKSLGRCLAINTTITSLNLRLNRLGDDGGRAIFDGLAENHTLLDLNLANNELGPAAAKSLSDVLRTNTTLTKLDITGNQLGDDSGRLLFDALEANAQSHLSSFDVRFAGVSDAERLKILDLLKRRCSRPK